MRRKLQIENKAGDISITILVLLVVLVCIVTIASFFFYRASSQDSFVGPGLIETIKTFSNEITFYSNNPGFSNKQGTSLNSGGVVITLNGNTIEGNYSEKSWPIISSTKTLVSVTYQR